MYSTFIAGGQVIPQRKHSPVGREHPPGSGVCAVRRASQPALAALADVNPVAWFAATDGALKSMMGPIERTALLFGGGVPGRAEEVSATIDYMNSEMKWLQPLTRARGRQASKKTIELAARAAVCMHQARCPGWPDRIAAVILRSARARRLHSAPWLTPVLAATCLRGTSSSQLRPISAASASGSHAGADRGGEQKCR
jgi:hypothetical protein